MASPWKSVFFELPANNETVWVRVLAIYGEPVLAQYKSNKMEFTTVTTSIVVTAIQVARWRSQ